MVQRRHAVKIHVTITKSDSTTISLSALGIPTHDARRGTQITRRDLRSYYVRNLAALAEVPQLFLALLLGAGGASSLASNSLEIYQGT